MNKILKVLEFITGKDATVLSYWHENNSGMRREVYSDDKDNIPKAERYGIFLTREEYDAIIKEATIDSELVLSFVGKGTWVIIKRNQSGDEVLFRAPSRFNALAFAEGRASITGEVIRAN